MSNVSSEAGDRSIDRSEGSRKSPKSCNPRLPMLSFIKSSSWPNELLKSKDSSPRPKRFACVVERSVSKPARRNLFFFAAVRGRRRLLIGSSGVCRNFKTGGRPLSRNPRVPKKFFGAGSEPARTPCAGGACRPGSPASYACPAPPPATTRGRETILTTCCAQGGGHWCGSFLWAAAAALAPRAGRKGLVKVFNSRQAQFFREAADRR